MLHNGFTLFVIIVLLLVTVQSGNWKPVSGPPTSFNIQQTHPTVKLSTTSFTTTNTFFNASIANHLTSFEMTSDVEHTTSSSNEDNVFSPDYGGIVTKSLSTQSTSSFPEDTCSVDKYAFDFKGTVNYEHQMPEMDQFTFCLWMRFTNHSGDHTLFTYSVDDEAREIQFWIANLKGSSFISMTVHGQSLYRLNYPLKVRVWHHVCSSWNGNTGEWQLWVKSERVGRGFHNRLVGHKIKSHGISFSGGSSITGNTAKNLHFEMTMLQIYYVALSAGKAHREHKHHHVHQFGHEGPLSTTSSMALSQTTHSPNSLIANGQFTSRVRINLAGADTNSQSSVQLSAQPSKVASDFITQVSRTLSTKSIQNEQFTTAGGILSEQLDPVFTDLNPRLTSRQMPFTLPVHLTTFINFTARGSTGFINDASPSRYIYKRGVTPSINNNDKKKHVNKRGLVIFKEGSIFDDSPITTTYQLDGLAQFGLPAFRNELKNRMNIDDEIKKHDREPAEDEVRAIMEVCTSCDIEPFKDAVAFTWRHLRVSLNGALKGRSIGGCGFF